MNAADQAFKELWNELEKEEKARALKDSKRKNRRRKVKPLPSSRKSRKSRIFYLPDELWKVLLNMISEQDKMRLALTSRSVYQKVWNLYLHEATHLCHAQIEREWNALAELCFASLRKNGTHQERGDVFCSVFPWRRHDLKVWYQRNTRDVDVLTWYIDDKMHAYTYL
jgi:hypothetical protein